MNDDDEEDDEDDEDDDEEQQEQKEKNTHDTEDPLSTTTVEQMSAPTFSRRASVVEPTSSSTKQRRLSTLSNTQRAGDVFRRPSFSNDSHFKGEVIGIPIPPTAAAKRRRSSALPPRASSLGKKRSITIEPPTASSSSSSQTIGTPVLPTPPPTQDGSVHQAMIKSQAKAPEDAILELNEGEGEKNGEAGGDGDNKIAYGTSKDNESAPLQKKAGIEVYSYNGVNVLKKTMYNPNDKEEVAKLIKPDHRVSRYDEISRSIYTLEPEVASMLQIDEDSFTMEDLCKPSLPIGRTSSQYEMAREAKKNRLAERMRKRSIRLRARDDKRSVESYEEDVKDETKPKRELDDDDEDDPAQSQVVIQLKMKDGAIAVDEDSTIVDRHKNANNIYRERHDENPFENIVNSATYGRQRYTDKWDNKEVAKFYKSLGQWGTDFALIAQMFPHRTRKQVKAKFILEEKRRPRLIELALMNKLGAEFNFDEYCSDSNKTFSTLNEFNGKLEKLKQEHDENLKELSIAREKAKEEDSQKQKKKEYEIQTGQRTMTRQERLTELTKHETVVGSIEDIRKRRQELEAAAAAAAEAA